MNNIYHYPPELFNLLVDTIPLLFRSKKDLIVFFRGAGIDTQLFNDIQNQIIKDRNSISKYEIVRTILSRLNEKGEKMLRERREVLKRVIEFESFETCWESDRLKAKALVHEIRQIINVKDSFTRIKQEKEKEALNKRKEYLLQLEEKQAKRNQIEYIKSELSQLFHATDPHKRGKALEGLLNRLFRIYGILVREDFTLKGDDGEGIVEQIDGVIELDGNLYLVEMKWWSKPLGNSDVSQHLVRIFNRGQARGIFISASDFTEPAIKVCRESLTRTTVILCNLYEVFRVLENETDLISFFRKKVQAAIIDKNPYYTSP